LSIITLIDTSVVRDRLFFSAAGFPMDQVDVLYGVYSKALTLMVLPSAFIVPHHRHRYSRHDRRPGNPPAEDASRIAETSLKLTNNLALPAGLGSASCPSRFQCFISQQQLKRPRVPSRFRHRVLYSSARS
jgi:hypothetical protein